jgi:hypothetical protein
MWCVVQGINLPGRAMYVWSLLQVRQDTLYSVCACMCVLCRESLGAVDVVDGQSDQKHNLAGSDSPPKRLQGKAFTRPHLS